ncbi:WAT1-related protein At4g16620-like [Phalaenopsis equestris]|uniref:WAT1-related protein At4g16620-like n=1 Tax=Phalaenopsis equestris TaxID=78828 RepID=UPI0009E558AA|nr:WAT1-related protein At4g16620-like [Phalaenopsis equestris]
MGTVICLSGAMAMSFLQGNSVKPAPSANLRSIFLREDSAINPSSNEWIIGCLYLLAAVVILSCVLVLQATTMVDFPAPMSLGVITSTIGSVFAVIFQYMLQGNINSGAASLGLTGVISAVLVGGSVSFISSTVVTMSVHKKGPVFVSVFHPTQTVCAAMLSALILKQFISLGSMIGMGLMFAGLYVVLWAKIREADKEESRLIPDEEKALLF